MISRWPASMAARNSRLICFVALPRHSMLNAKSETSSGNGLGNGNRPHLHGPRRWLLRHKTSAQRLPQGDLLCGDGDEIVRLGDHQRFETEAVLDIGQSAAPGREITE